MGNVPVEVPADVRYRWGHESFLPVFEQPLARSFARRYEALIHRDMDSAPAGTLEALHELWGVENADDGQAKWQLQSFTACADLSRRLRARAVVCRDTHKRLLLARAALRVRRDKLRANVALEEALQSVR